MVPVTEEYIKSAVIIIADLEKNSYSQDMKEEVINSAWTGFSEGG